MINNMKAIGVAKVAYGEGCQQIKTAFSGCANAVGLQCNCNCTMNQIQEISIVSCFQID